MARIIRDTDGTELVTVYEEGDPEFNDPALELMGVGRELTTLIPKRKPVRCIVLEQLIGCRSDGLCPVHRVYHYTA
jgi:hypothetical protein